jgi:CheY-like chemotaxis protein
MYVEFVRPGSTFRWRRHATTSRESVSRAVECVFDERVVAARSWRITAREACMARIVVADNDLDALDLALTDLRLEGHEVYGALDAADAEALVDKVSPDVVVLDYRMPPGITGLELAERLVAEDPDLRIVIYSNYQKVELRARAARIGVPFLTKGNLRSLRAAVLAE